MLIGNKSDIGEKKLKIQFKISIYSVNPEKAKQYAGSKRMEFYEASAKTSD